MTHEEHLTQLATDLSDASHRQGQLELLIELALHIETQEDWTVKDLRAWIAVKRTELQEQTTSETMQGSITYHPPITY